MRLSSVNKAFGWCQSLFLVGGAFLFILIHFGREPSTAYIGLNPDLHLFPSQMTTHAYDDFSRTLLQGALLVLSHVVLRVCICGCCTNNGFRSHHGRFSFFLGCGLL